VFVDRSVEGRLWKRGTSRHILQGYVHAISTRLFYLLYCMYCVVSVVSDPNDLALLDPQYQLVIITSHISAQQEFRRGLVSNRNYGGWGDIINRGGTWLERNSLYGDF
jgi:hypothetical protein